LEIRKNSGKKSEKNPRNFWKMMSKELENTENSSEQIGKMGQNA